MRGVREEEEGEDLDREDIGLFIFRLPKTCMNAFKLSQGYIKVGISNFHAMD